MIDSSVRQCLVNSFQLPHVSLESQQPRSPNIVNISTSINHIIEVDEADNFVLIPPCVVKKEKTLLFSSPNVVATSLK